MTHDPIYIVRSTCTSLNDTYVHTINSTVPEGNRYRPVFITKSKKDFEDYNSLQLKKEDIIRKKSQNKYPNKIKTTKAKFWKNNNNIRNSLSYGKIRIDSN